MRERVLEECDSLGLASLGGDPPLSLLICGRDPRPRERLFPTHGLQRGVLLSLSDRDISGEGMGFGVPVIRVKGRTIFPGSAIVRIEESPEEASELVHVHVVYSMDRVQTVHLGGGKAVGSRRFYRLHEWAAAVHRRFRSLRKFLSWGGGVLKSVGRADFDWAESECMGSVSVRLAIHLPEARIDVDVDYCGLCAESGVLSCLNELDGRLFDRYEDSGGVTLKGDEIGGWELVQADEVSLRSVEVGLRYRMRQVPGAKMFLGREDRRPDLAWSGFDYEVPLFREGGTRLQYSVWIDRVILS